MEGYTCRPMMCIKRLSTVSIFKPQNQGTTLFIISKHLIFMCLHRWHYNWLTPQTIWLSPSGMMPPSLMPHATYFIIDKFSLVGYKSRRLFSLTMLLDSVTYLSTPLKSLMRACFKYIKFIKCWSWTKLLKYVKYYTFVNRPWIRKSVPYVPSRYVYFLHILFNLDGWRVIMERRRGTLIRVRLSMSVATI